MKVFVILAIIAGVLSQNPPAPVWPNRWQASFTEIHLDNTTFLVNGTTTGLYSFDFIYNASRVDRLNGAGDAICATTLAGNYTCSQMVVNGSRYIYFPQKGFCCYCCGESDGCGVLKPSWMSDSTYLSTNIGPNGETLYSWENSDDGIAYYTERDDHAPYQVFRTPNKDTMVFDLKTYSTTFSKTIFDLPPVCKTSQTCPTNSKCTLFRGQTEVVSI